MLEPAASQPGDQHQDIGEHLPWHRDLGHLEREIAAVAGALGGDLDELLSRRLVSDHGSPVAGIASVRMKLSRL